MNAWVLWAARLENLVVLPAVSPYDTPTSVHALSEFRAMLERRPLRPAARQDGQGRCGRANAAARWPSTSCPGHFRRSTATATASPPTDGRVPRPPSPTYSAPSAPTAAAYWDGLFSQNPPVRELVDTRARRAVGDPDQPPGRWDREPRTIARDRRPAQRAGRQPVAAPGAQVHREGRPAAGGGPAGPDGRLKQIVVRLIELTRPPLSRSLGTASKLNRDPAFLADCSLTARPRPRSSWPRWPLSGPGETATLMPCSAASPTTPNCGRRRRSLTEAACAAASGSDALCASISPPTCMSTRPASRWPGTWSAGRCRPGGTMEPAGPGGRRGRVPGREGRSPAVGRPRNRSLRTGILAHFEVASDRFRRRTCRVVGRRSEHVAPWLSAPGGGISDQCSDRLRHLT